MMRMSKFLLVCGLPLALMIEAPRLAAADETNAAPPPSQEASGGSEAMGKETVCKNGAMIRRVKVGMNDGVACQVSYLKETEEPSAGEKILWNAKQEANYCQDKADGFIEKLKGMGWSCE